MLLAVLVSGINAAWGQNITFDFEDDTAHRTSGSNSYSSTGNSYSENGVPINLTYADAVTSGSPLNGSANVTARVAKNSTNSPTIIIGPIVNSGYKITGISYKVKGVSTVTLAMYTSPNNNTWTSRYSATACPSSVETRSVSNLLITDDNVYIKFTAAVSSSTSSNRDVQLDDVVITREAVAAYAITAVSNDEDMGTVSGTTTITASPKSGFRVKEGDAGYDITSGTATVINNGDNTFSVSASTDCTVQINFEAIPTHTATFSVNGNTSRTATVAEGEAITFPEAVADPSASQIPETYNGKTFLGWYTSAYSDASVAPSYVNTAAATMGNANVTYYAVYADVAEEESEDLKDATLSQTLQYDEWTYSGTTTDKSTYRLFGEDSYIQSAAFDLSKLIKVVVYGGTYGGESTYNSGTIGDGTNKWCDITLTGTGNTKAHTFTGGTALSGTKALRITSTAGNGTGSGLRISKVEIYVKGTVRTESNYTTDARSEAGISFTEAEVSVKLTSGYAGQALTNSNSVTVAYSSSDETVATVNGSTGAITELLKAGTTTITATFAGDATYKPAEVSYALTVTEKTPCGLAYAVAEVEKLTTDGTFTNALTNGNSLTVAYSSIDTDVATVNPYTGEVTIKGAGSTTITATFGGDATYEEGEASYELTVSKAAPTLSFASENATGREGEAFDGNELSNPENLTVSYSSSDTGVATVNESTGAITIVAGGTTTITASFSGNDTYTAGSASYTLKVLATPTIPAMSDEEIAWGETFTVDDSGITGGTVTVTSGNTSIATVDGLEITPVACGEVEITVSTAEDETYKDGSTTFRLTVTAPAGKTTAPSAETTYAFDFTDNTEWSFPEGSSNKTTTSTNYTADGKTITLGGGGSGNGHYFNTDGYLMLGKEGATLTLPAFDKPVTQIDVVGRGGASSTVGQNIYVGSETVSTGTTGAQGTNKYEIDSEYQAAGTIYTLKVTSANNTQITGITVHMYQAPSTTVSLNASGYGTFCSVNPMDFSATDGYTAWRISSIEMENETTGTVTCNKITGTIKGGQGVLLYNKDADGVNKTDVTVTFADGTTEFSHSDNLLIGTTAPTYVASNEYFGLSGSNFVKVNEGVVPAGKALLDADDIPDFGSVKSFIFVFNDDATGITETRTATREEVEAIFNLGGQRMSKMQRGVNIVNGKKVLVK